MTEHKMVTRTKWARPPLEGKYHYGSCECGVWNARCDLGEPEPANELSRLFREHVEAAERNPR